SDAAARYIEVCKSTFLKKYDLKGIKLVLDCANGATYHIAPHIFTELGAKVITINHQPDGFNINEECGSTAPTSLQKAVIENNAELGIAFDGDGDRVIFVDHKGEVVDGDELLYIIARGYAVRGELNGGVVGTQMSNLGLENALAELNIPFIRTKVGDRYVMDALMQQGWCLGGEGSGHIICLNKTTTGDGIIAALQVLGQICQSEQSLHELKKGMVKCAQILLNVPVQSGQQVVQNERVQEACNKAQKALASEGRILLRPFGTEPLVRVMVEGENQERIEQVAKEIANIVSEVAKETS
ncbi:MAG TPA: phosphoglucosamine mutase, partial [Candidatus Berkiella sp.]|nr:phosphoglucosamine mutase [Candidatus Berkiella sp.]